MFDLQGMSWSNKWFRPVFFFKDLVKIKKTLKSDFQSRNVLTEYHSKEERRQLEHYGISIRNLKIKTNKEPA